MNERIRQLSEQAHHSTADELAHLQRVHNRTYDLNESAAIYKEKFAELIVQECAKVILETPVEYLEIDAMHRVRDRVKNHFGV